MIKHNSKVKKEGILKPQLPDLERLDPNGVLDKIIKIFFPEVVEVVLFMDCEVGDKIKTLYGYKNCGDCYAPNPRDFRHNEHCLSCETLETAIIKAIAKEAPEGANAYHEGRRNRIGRIYEMKIPVVYFKI